MIERDYSELFDFCSGTCELGDILQLVAIVAILIGVVVGFLFLVHRKMERGDYTGRWGGS